MPGGILIVATSKEGDDIPALEMTVDNESIVDNQSNEIETASYHTERRMEEALINQDTMVLNKEPLHVGDDLGMVESSKSSENIEEQNDIIKDNFDNTNLPLGQWVNMLRRSRRIAREEVLDPFVDAEPVENHGASNETISMTMLHKAIGDNKKDYSSFEPNLQDNSMLKEAMSILKTRKNTRYLENCIIGFLLMSVKAGIRQYGDRAIDALLKEFMQLNDMDVFLGTDSKKLV